MPPDRRRFRQGHKEGIIDEGQQLRVGVDLLHGAAGAVVGTLDSHAVNWRTVRAPFVKAIPLLNESGLALCLDDVRRAPSYDGARRQTQRRDRRFVNLLDGTVPVNDRKASPWSVPTQTTPFLTASKAWM